ncbi:MAG: hypothetical protein JWM57_3840 [Phycisphaerales bacterium]|nr:hypothetical protein [Phycisphaerales bacterium]
MLFTPFRQASALLVCTAAIPVHAAGLLVPAYFQPADHAADWAALTSGASKVAVTAIFNPNSGPGTAAEPAYTSALATFRAAGGTAVAYVHTHNTDGSLRTAAAVDDEINRYRSFYQFDGIFVDEMSNTTTDVSYYLSLYSSIKAKDANWVLIGNPGTNVPSGYSNVADQLVTFEDYAINYAANTPRSWTQSQPASRFATIVHDASASQLTGILSKASTDHVGYVYVTDDGADGNAYDSLPSYRAAEVAAVTVPEPTACGFAVLGLAQLARRGGGRVRKETT